MRQVLVQSLLTLRVARVKGRDVAAQHEREFCQHTQDQDTRDGVQIVTKTAAG